MNKKFIRSLGLVVINTGIFWMFMDILPGALFRLNALGKLIAALGFDLTLAFGSFLVNFLRLPRVWFVYLIIRILLVFAYLYLLITLAPTILVLGPSYIGGADLIFLKIPMLITLPYVMMTIGFSAIFLVFCSIIFDKFKK
jgi:hypothetical protein